MADSEPEAPPWATYKTPEGAHVVPLHDLIAHELAPGCVCGPEFEHLTADDGSDAWLTSHQSLDRREGQETTQ